MSTAPTWLPTYDLGPGRSGDELVVNLLIYGMLLALLLSVVWAVVIPTVQTRRDNRRDR